MDLEKRLKELSKQIEQYEKQANATINQMVGKRELLKELIEECDDNGND